MMYMVADWEIVHSIYRPYTCMFLPNLRSTSFFVMYSDVLRWTIIHILVEVTYEKLVHDMTSSDSCCDYRSLVEKRWRDLVQWRMPVSV
jgi:hypothetical protein